MPSNDKNNKVNIFESIERRFLSGDYELAELRKLDINEKEVYQFYGYLKQDKVLNIKFKGFIKQRKDNTNNITGIITSFYSETNETNFDNYICINLTKPEIKKILEIMNSDDSYFRLSETFTVSYR